MRIFLSFLQSGSRHNIPAYSFWEYYVKNGIAEAGHAWDEATGVDWAYGIVPKSAAEQKRWKENAWEQTVSYLKRNPADLFLGYLYPEQVDQEAIRQIKKMGIPCANFFCDNVRNFKHAPAEFSEFDLNWVPEYKAAGMYKKAGYPYINLPMPLWLEPGLRKVPAERNSGVTFIGSKDIQRQLLFEQVVAKAPDLQLGIYGSGWIENAGAPGPADPAYTLKKKIRYQYDFVNAHGIPAYLRKLSQLSVPVNLSNALASKMHGTLSFETYNELTAASMITVGVNRYPSYSFPLDRPDTYSRLRDIEAPMLGACYLTEYTEGIENMYDTNSEIAIYRNADDFIEKVSQLQCDKKKRDMLRVNGQKRALRDHSIPRSIELLTRRIV